MRSGPSPVSAADLSMTHMGPPRRRDRPVGPHSLDEDDAFYERKTPPMGGPRPAPPPFWRTAWAPPPHAVHSRGISGRDADSCSPSFSGLAFAVGLLAGLLIASAAFTGGLWWRHVHRKRRRNRKRLTINPYTGPHHIITEPAISPPATVANMMSSTTQLVTAGQSQPNSPGSQLPRSSSTRSTAAHSAAQSAAQSKLRASRSESSLPLPIVHRDAQGKFSTVHQAESVRGRQSGVGSLFSASVADGFRTGAHTSVAYTAEPSTATAEHFPRSPIAMPTQSHPSSPHTPTAASGLPFAAPSLRSRALSLESLARTAVARDSVSSVGSTWSSRTRVVNAPPPLPPPTQPLPSIPPLEAHATGSSWRSASDEKRLLQLQDALYASQTRSNSTPSSPTVHSPTHHSTHSAGRTSSLRPLPEAPEDAPPVPQSARDAKSFLADAPPSSFHRAPVSPTHFTAESSHGHRDTAPPPAYSRPPSSSG